MSNIKKYPNSLPLPFKIYYNKPYNNYRRLKVLILSHILRSYDDFCKISLNEQFKIIQKIEDSCYSSAVELANTEYNLNPNFDNDIFQYIYNDVCGNLFSNLDSDSLVNSEYLIDNILDGKIKISKLGKMTSQDMCPDKYIKLLKIINIKNNVQYTIKYSDIDKCKKCGDKKCCYQRMQNRSLDEGTCYRYTCLNCGNTWMTG